VLGSPPVPAFVFALRCPVHIATLLAAVHGDELSPNLSGDRVGPGEHPVLGEGGEKLRASSESA
jgi:hypothetical protein